jgi:hypothetical protein
MIPTSTEAPPLFIFVKASSKGPAIKKFNREVLDYLRKVEKDFLDVYQFGGLREFAPDPVVWDDDGTPRISDLAKEFVAATGLAFGDVYPDLVEAFGARTSPSTKEDEEAA